MTYVITQNCCNDAACVRACPVNCIHPTPEEPGYATAEMLYIDPAACIDCGACVDACPVDAIVPDFELPKRFAIFEDLNAQYYRDPAHQDYAGIPATRPSRSWVGSPQGPLRVAIVGTGPAALYAAAAVLEQRSVLVTIDMFERLATPWGLLRSGVAPDHQGTKSAEGGFARTVRRPEVRMFFGVEVGRTIAHEDLAVRYHAVIYAVGAHEDRPLAIPGEDLPGSHSAAEFVAWYNGHPDYADRSFDLSCQRAVVIGNGNVALDVARILLHDVDALGRTDIADHALLQLRESQVREVLVVGRRGPVQAAFTTPELLGLAAVEDIDVTVHSGEASLDMATVSTLGDPAYSLPHYKARLIAKLGTHPDPLRRHAVLRFLLSPQEILGRDRVESVRFVRNALHVDGAGEVVARPTDEVEDVACGLVLRAVGYRGAPVPGLPFDPRSGLLPHREGRVLDAAKGSPLAGVYATGWIKRGPSGVIGTNKECAQETVNGLFDDWIAGCLLPPSQASDISSMLPEKLGLLSWKAIDDHERATGKNASRPRVKIVDREALLALARSAAS